MPKYLSALIITGALTLFGAQAFAQNLHPGTISVGTSTVPVLPTFYPYPQTTNLPPFSLASTETAQVNLTNIATLPTTSAATLTASCAGTVTFYNAAGTAVGTPHSFTIASGATSSISLPFASAGLTGTQGILRAVVTQTIAANTVCSLLTSLQTTDTSSGVTHLFLPGNPNALQFVSLPSFVTPAL